MTDLDKMWAALAAHQPIANAKGYGPAWAKMCNSRTWTAARNAADAAKSADSATAAHAAAYAAARVDADQVAAAARAAADKVDAAHAHVVELVIQQINTANQEADHD